MAQEIITYIIIAVAVIITLLKFKKEFVKKKRIANSPNTTNSSQHNCSDCSAGGCTLRNTIDPQKVNELKICDQTKTTNKDL